ncbi:MAG: DNA polymerase III subunit delta [Clostridia bacterium]|nr:DNA polymerase III subunit delta [Clostridia bacterium]
MVKFFEFKNFLLKNDTSPVYLLEGEDLFFRKEGIEILKNTFISMPDFNFKEYDFSETTVETLISSLLEYPLGERFRMLVVREFYPKAEVLKKFDQFFNKLESTIFVIVNEKKHLPFSKIEGLVTIDCNKESPTVLGKWIVNLLKEKELKIELSLAEMIAEYCSLDMVKINNEANKIIDFYEKGKVVDKQTVDNLITKDIEYQIYEMTDFVGKKNFQMALSSINEMLKKGETQQRLLSSIYNYFRRLFFIATTSLTNQEIAEMLGTKEYAIKKSKEQLKNFKTKALKKAVDTLADYDYFVKSGKILVGNAIFLEVFKIMVGG